MTIENTNKLVHPCPSAIRYPWWVPSFETWGETSLEQTEKRSYESRKKSPLKKVCLRDFFLSFPWVRGPISQSQEIEWMDAQNYGRAYFCLPLEIPPCFLSFVPPEVFFFQWQCSKMSEARQKCFNMDLFNQPLEDLDQSESNKKRCPNQCIYIYDFELATNLWFLSAAKGARETIGAIWYTVRL